MKKYPKGTKISVELENAVGFGSPATVEIENELEAGCSLKNMN